MEECRTGSVVYIPLHVEAWATAAARIGLGYTCQNHRSAKVEYSRKNNKLLNEISNSIPLSILSIPGHRTRCLPSLSPAYNE